MRHIEISSVGFNGTKLHLQSADSSAVSEQVLEALSDLYEGKPVVMDFNPFVVEFSLKSGVDVEAFFNRMAGAVTTYNKYLKVQIPKFPPKEGLATRPTHEESSVAYMRSSRPSGWALFIFYGIMTS